MAGRKEQKQEQEAEKKKEKKFQDKEAREEVLVRIAGQDIFGSKKLFVGLTKIKGVSWSIAKATLLKLGMDKNKRISDLTKQEILNIEAFLKNPDLKDFLKNRRNDLETGESSHNITTNLEIKKDFDLRRLKKIRSYKGLRHNLKLPVRGQRTRSHFRKKGQAVRVKKKK